MIKCQWKVNHQAGRPSTSRNENIIAQVQTLVTENRHFTVRELAKHIGVSIGSLYSILTEDFKMRECPQNLFQSC